MFYLLTYLLLAAAIAKDYSLIAENYGLHRISSPTELHYIDNVWISM